jgi:hypothetical protein
MSKVLVDVRVFICSVSACESGVGEFSAAASSRRSRRSCVSVCIIFCFLLEVGAGFCEIAGVRLGVVNGFGMATAVSIMSSSSSEKLGDPERTEMEVFLKLTPLAEGSGACSCSC